MSRRHPPTHPKHTHTHTHTHTHRNRRHGQRLGTHHLHTRWQVRWARRPHFKGHAERRAPTGTRSTLWPEDRHAGVSSLYSPPHHHHHQHTPPANSRGTLLAASNRTGRVNPAAASHRPRLCTRALPPAQPPALARARPVGFEASSSCVGAASAFVGTTILLIRSTIHSCTAVAPALAKKCTF